jgi:hypothetical protein
MRCCSTHWAHLRVSQPSTASRARALGWPMSDRPLPPRRVGGLPSVTKAKGYGKVGASDDAVEVRTRTRFCQPFHTSASLSGPARSGVTEGAERRCGLPHHGIGLTDSVWGDLACRFRCSLSLVPLRTRF